MVVQRKTNRKILEKLLKSVDDSWASFFTNFSLVTLIFLSLIKIILAFKLPVLGDEAYYIFWGTHPAGGYYDLPPMIGWWESFLTHISLDPFWLRIPNLLVSVLVTWGIYDVLKEFGQRRAQLIATIYFVMPIQLLSVLITPDVPLVFFSFFSALLYFTADREWLEKGRKLPTPRVWITFLFAGVLWGAAFLSKYFALMMIPSVVMWILISRQSKKTRYRALMGLGIAAIGAIPFVFQHIWWNSQNCWANFVFNLVTRQQASDGPFYQTFGFFILYLLILVTPVLLLDVFRTPRVELFRNGNARGFEKIMQETLLQKYCFCLWVIPIFLFGLSALFGKGQGLHWYLSYVPFFIIWLGLKIPERAMSSRLTAMSALTAVLGVTVCVLISSPRWVNQNILHGRFKLDIEMSMKTKELAMTLAPWVRQAQEVVTDSYNFASVLDLTLRRYYIIDPFSHHRSVGMWGSGSRFGRVFDWTTDYKALSRESILLVSGDALPYERFGKYFKSVKVEKLSIGDADFYVSLGKGFKADDYINEVVAPAIAQFYPAWIFPSRCSLRGPVFPGGYQ